jgi:hypothetical protein
MEFFRMKGTAPLSRAEVGGIQEELAKTQRGNLI